VAPRISRSLLTSSAGQVGIRSAGIGRFARSREGGGPIQAMGPSQQATTSFNIVALGPPGSGKTVYLATLHHIIGGQSLAKGISFTTSPVERSYLQSIYDQVINPDREWPDSTHPGKPLRETKFTCTVEWTSGGSLLSSRPLSPRPRRFRFPVFDITYIDYAGEWNTRAHDVEGELFRAFEAKLNNAHAILGMIDGLRLLQYLEKDDAGRTFFHDELRPIVELIRGSDAPAHFVITKWDLLENKYSLGDISRCLLDSDNTGFRELIDSRTGIGRWGRSPVGQVRLIPVSSVGNFARLERPDWEITKAPGIEPKQVNVEVPLVAAVLDVCGRALRILRQQANERSAHRSGASEAAAPGDQKYTSDVEVNVGPRGVTLNLSAIIAFTFNAGLKVSRQLGVPTARLARSMRREYRRLRAGGLKMVKSEEAALLYVARAFETRLKTFEECPAYQDSVLVPPG
jgi:hypothetical protein